MSDEHVTFAGVLAFVGGLLILIIGVLAIYAGANGLTIAPNIGLPSSDVNTLIFLGIAYVVLGFFIIVLSLSLVAYPEYHVGIGALIIFLALISLVGIGLGEEIGFLLVVLGGATAIAFDPGDPNGVAYHQHGPETILTADVSDRGAIPGLATFEGIPPSKTTGAPTLYRGCVNCGKASPTSYESCPNCGGRF